MPLLPIITENNKLIDGQFIKCHLSCSRTYSTKKCAEFYSNLKTEDKSGFFQCPYGMTAYYDSEKKYIYTCFRVKGFSDAKKERSIMNRSIIPINPLLTELEAQSLISAAKEYSKLEDSKEKIETEFNTLTHEIKGLNSRNATICDDVLTQFFKEEENPISVEQAQILKERFRTVYYASKSIEQRFKLNDIDDLSNDSYDDYRLINIYKKFDKISKFYSSKKQRITLIGNSYKKINADSMFEYIPMLLIDNAVKYSYNNGPVEIQFNEDADHHLHVSIESFGPYCEKAELEKLTEKNFRGKNAMKIVDVYGSGLGLYYVRHLCELFDIECSFESDSKSVTKLNDIKYAKFTANLFFD